MGHHFCVICDQLSCLLLILRYPGSVVSDFFFFFFLTRSGCLSESLLEKPVSALTFLQEKVTTKYVSNRDDAGCMVVKG